MLRTTSTDSPDHPMSGICKRDEPHFPHGVSPHYYLEFELAIGKVTTAELHPLGLHPGTLLAIYTLQQGADGRVADDGKWSERVLLT